MNKLNLDDTIVAISTPIGEAGIGIVRLSGRDSLSIADKIFISKEKIKPSKFKTYTTHYGWIVDRKQESENRSQKEKNRKGKSLSSVICFLDSGLIDEVILTVMRAPKSYTKEDIVEINCHSGIVPLKKILDLTLKNGARLAEAGEFTRRALLNGRIDLIQAEAVLDIIKAKTEKALAVGLNQLKGKLSHEIELIRNFLLDIYAEIEAMIDFPEEEIKNATSNGLLKRIKKFQQRINGLLENASQGRILREGISVVICGKPNVGKSSLLNLILRHPRAIVTELPGTTRDTIEEIAEIKGIPIKIIDTAGIIEPRDLVEQEAIKRSHNSISSADLVILVLDASKKISPEDNLLIRNLWDKKVICAINKCDLKVIIDFKKVRKLLPLAKIVKISCLKNQGIAKLEEEVSNYIWQGKVWDTQDILVSNVRQINYLRNTNELIEKAKSAMGNGQTIEIVAEELKAALEILDEVSGKNLSSDLLDRIFSKFCIGK